MAYTTTITTLDESAWIEALDMAAADAGSGCGCSFVVYQQRISASIDTLLRDVPEAHQAHAVRIARNKYDYATPDELAQTEQALANDDKWCIHGIERFCCPCGCGDI